MTYGTLCGWAKPRFVEHLILRRVGLAQIELSNDMQINFNKHIRVLEEVNADIVVFHECSLIGYDLQSIASDINNIAIASRSCVESLAAVCHNLGKVAVVGVAISDRERVFNSSIVIGLSDKLFRYDKRNLTESEFDIFCPGHKNTVINLDGVKIGLLICRDQSNDKYFKEYVESGASLILIQAAHYYPPCEALRKRVKNKAVPIVRALDNKIHVAKVNSVGSLGEKISFGNSMVADPYGDLIDSLDEIEEKTLLFTI